MSLLFLEGFEDGFHNSAVRHAGSNWVRSGTYARYGSYGGWVDNNVVPRFDLGAVYTETYMGFAYKPSTASSGTDGYIMGGTQAAGSVNAGAWSLRHSSNYGLQVLRINTSQGIYSSIFTIGSWHYIEVRCLVNDTTGILEVKVNNAVVHSETNVDTKYSTDTGIRYLSVDGDTYHNGYFDDIYVCDTTGTKNNTYLGDIRVDGLFPNGNGTYSQLLGQDADSTDNYLNVDELDTDDDTSYNESATAGNKDTYAYTNHPEATGTIIGMTLTQRVRKTDTAAKQYRRVLRSGSTDYTGSDVSLGTGYADTQELFEDDPNTSTSWTIAGINAVEAGIEVRA